MVNYNSLLSNNHCGSGNRNFSLFPFMIHWSHSHVFGVKSHAFTFYTENLYFEMQIVSELLRTFCDHSQFICDLYDSILIFSYHTNVPISMLGISHLFNRQARFTHIIFFSFLREWKTFCCQSLNKFTLDKLYLIISMRQLRNLHEMRDKLV